MDAVAGDLGVGGQGDLGVDRVRAGRVVSDGHHPLEEAAVMESVRGEPLVEALGFDGRHARRGSERRGSGLIPAEGTGGVQHPRSAPVSHAGAAMHGERPPDMLVNGVNGNLQIDGRILG
ncbi:hypothetical protein MSIMFI_05482 [Mycobacterium simulans]|nr:hypothetical protein MSIMFI_05482 [Mycobacterium simulans]